MNVCDDHQIYTDAKWLKFAIGQVVTNAVKYSAGKSDRLELNVFCDEDRTVLEVKDYGVGIPSQDIKRVFDPYYTGENGRRFQESTGIGLHPSKKLQISSIIRWTSARLPVKGHQFDFHFLQKCKAALRKQHSPLCFPLITWIYVKGIFMLNVPALHESSPDQQE